MILFRPTVLLFGALLLGISHAQDDGIDIEEEAAATVTDEDSAVPVISYSTPDISGHFYESFDNNEAFKKRWVKSGATKDGSQEFKYDGEWSVAQAHDLTPGDSSLMTNSQAKHHAYSAKLDKPFKFGGNKPFIFQYEVQFRNGQECGGAYVKLLTSAGELSKLNDKSQYSIMFGPDKCGGDMKLHFIFNHKNPKNGTLSEKHWKDSANVEGLDKVFSDKNWHLIRLEIYPDNSFKVSIDEKFVKEGNMLDDFKPAVNPPKMIDDPNDSKPEDWDEREKIPDPSAVKPAEWDEDAPRKITDPSAVKPADWQEDTPEDIPDSEAKMPEDWDVEMDGEWEAPKIQNPACSGISGCGKWVAPLIDNPAYKGKWKAPMISNPAFKGKWSPRKIQNPDFFEDFKPFHRLSTVDAVFFELWTISDGIAFDNILITDDMVEAQKLSDAVFHVKKDLTVVKSEDNFAIKALRYANDNPWMWAVYMLGAGVPLVLFIAFCCVSPRAKKDADYAEAKKTDKPTQEDVIEEVEELIEEDDVQVDDDDAEEEEDDDEAVADDVEEVEEEAPRSPASSSRRRPRRE